MRRRLPIVILRLETFYGEPSRRGAGVRAASALKPLSRGENDYIIRCPVSDRCLVKVWMVSVGLCGGAAFFFLSLAGSIVWISRAGASS